MNNLKSLDADPNNGKVLVGRVEFDCVIFFVLMG